MGKALAVVPELCSGCKICELACAIERFGTNNPKKAALRVLVAYPHPVMRLPIVCSQCKVPVCADACPVEALSRDTDVVHLDDDSCISCMKCVDACPFGAIYAHSDVDHPIKCDLCGGDPACATACPTDAITYIDADATGYDRMRAWAAKSDAGAQAEA